MRFNRKYLCNGAHCIKTNRAWQSSEEVSNHAKKAICLAAKRSFRQNVVTLLP